MSAEPKNYSRFRYRAEPENFCGRNRIFGSCVIVFSVFRKIRSRIQNRSFQHYKYVICRALEAIKFLTLPLPMKVKRFRFKRFRFKRFRFHPKRFRFHPKRFRFHSKRFRIHPKHLYLHLLPLIYFELRYS